MQRLNREASILPPWPGFTLTAFDPEAEAEADTPELTLEAETEPFTVGPELTEVLLPLDDVNT